MLCAFSIFLPDHLKIHMRNGTGTKLPIMENISTVDQGSPKDTIPSGTEARSSPIGTMAVKNITSSLGKQSSRGI